MYIRVNQALNWRLQIMADTHASTQSTWWQQHHRRIENSISWGTTKKSRPHNISSAWFNNQLQGKFQQFITMIWPMERAGEATSSSSLPHMPFHYIHIYIYVHKTPQSSHSSSSSSGKINPNRLANNAMQPTNANNSAQLLRSIDCTLDYSDDQKPWLILNVSYILHLHICTHIQYIYIYIHTHTYIYIYPSITYMQMWIYRQDKDILHRYSVSDFKP